MPGRAVGMPARRRGLMAVVTLSLILAFSAQNATAQTRSVSGAATLSNTLEYGNTSYSIEYTHPVTAQVGTNFTITIFLHVNAITGLAEYITNYRIIVNLFLGTQYALNGSITSSYADPYLYPGADWGPRNVSIPLTAENTGVTRGQSANATVRVTLGDTIHYGGQIGTFIPEPLMQGSAGTVILQNSLSTSNGQAGSQSFLPYALMASGVVLMLSAALLPRARSP